VRPEHALRYLWLAWWATWVLAAFWSDRASKRPSTWRQIDYRVLAAIGTVLLFGLYRHRLESEIILWRLPPVAAWSMIPIAIAGFWFTWWARIHLGRLWSSSVTRKADHRVVDTGPYGIVRHPIYTGIILASVATATLRGTALSWLGATIMTLGWYVKARLEERFLRQELGDEAYAAYARRVPMLVPFIGRSAP
jgi:protein-S-isoprenylcysteine O-methyltransferase Ste14